jgi:hypothetical protein
LAYQPPANNTFLSNQPPATSQQYFSLRTNQHQSSGTSQTNRHVNSTTSNQPSTQGSADPTSGLHSYGPLHPTLHAQSAKKKETNPKAQSYPTTHGPAILFLFYRQVLSKKGAQGTEA